VRLAVAFLAFTVAACGSGSSDPAASASTSGASMTDYRTARDAICVVGSDDIAAINATMDGLAGQELRSAMLRVADRIRQAQAALDALDAPAELAAFIEADNARRATRLELLERLATAAVDDPGAMDAIDVELTALNVESEHEEDLRALKHCA